MRFVQSDKYVSIMINEKNLEKVMEIIPKDKIVRTDTKLAEINLHLPLEGRETPGILAAISNELMMNDINIVDSMSCYSEGLWIIDEKNILKAYDVIDKMCQPVDPPPKYKKDNSFS